MSNYKCVTGFQSKKDWRIFRYGEIIPSTIYNALDHSELCNFRQTYDEPHTNHSSFDSGSSNNDSGSSSHSFGGFGGGSFGGGD